MSEAFTYAWRDPVSDEEMVDLVRSHGGNDVAGWWEKIRAYSLGWLAARDADGLLVGFVNVAWDGGDHAFLVDAKTRGTHQRRGIGAAVVRLAASCARESGCEWLHVDFEPELRGFYFGACGFRPTEAGVIRLRS
ncbi:GNAT family N-acetyltransferase [Streptomyces sp. NPDC006422]|uniref:GNAT family N-acetyltransferase n=1 Tax=unclassified Streptomyces TaxID=2593676 RepID=UPI0033A2783E